MYMIMSVVSLFCILDKMHPNILKMHLKLSVTREDKISLTSHCLNEDSVSTIAVLFSPRLIILFLSCSFLLQITPTFAGAALLDIGVVLAELQWLLIPAS